MLRTKKYRYLFDLLRDFDSTKFLRAISVVPSITNFVYSKDSQVLEVTAATDPGESIKMACEVAGARLRVQMKKARSNDTVRVGDS
jgi:hypothetical protein